MLKNAAILGCRGGLFALLGGIVRKSNSVVGNWNLVLVFFATGGVVDCCHEQFNSRLDSGRVVNGWVGFVVAVSVAFWISSMFEFWVGWCCGSIILILDVLWVLVVSVVMRCIEFDGWDSVVVLVDVGVMLM